jgi:crossover junction endodeoxyribonuclease RuvC
MAPKPLRPEKSSGFSVFLFSVKPINLKDDRIILGIDPGTNIMGFGLVSVSGKSFSLISIGVLKLSRTDDHALRLKNIFEKTLALIEEFKPDEMAIEAPFFGKNVQSMLKLGRAQGVAMAAGLFRSIPIFEYSPRKIKQSITGNGNASKEQVAAMLYNLMSIKEPTDSLDATDGLAVAVCHLFQKSSQRQGKEYSGWRSYISDHPEKLT